MKLIDEKTGVEIKVGDAVKTFHGEAATVTGMAQPRHGGSTGRVYVRMEGYESDCAFFPSVIGAKWIK